MITAWIVITLMLALLVGIIAAGTADSFERGFVFVWAFMFVCSISFMIAVVYVAGHFIQKYW